MSGKYKRGRKIDAIDDGVHSAERGRVRIRCVAPRGIRGTASP